MNLMKNNEVIELWNQALTEILGGTFNDDVINVLSLQTIDSIRRISIYKTYRKKAEQAEAQNLPYSHTSNPFTLSQRDSLSLNSKAWYIYLATYFGKSDTSNWKLFNNAVFREDGTLIDLESILENREEYFDYLRSFDFFKETKYSNHRKYIAKSLDGDRGVLRSMDYFLDNINDFACSDPTDFHLVYKKSHKIPNFARMGAFDFTSSLCKCNLNIKDPESMYLEGSTGPLKALKDMLKLSGLNKSSKAEQISFGNELLNWFMENSDIEIAAQVIEDAICNWQKSPNHYERYFG